MHYVLPATANGGVRVLGFQFLVHIPRGLGKILEGEFEDMHVKMFLYMNFSTNRCGPKAQMQGYCLFKPPLSYLIVN